MQIIQNKKKALHKEILQSVIYISKQNFNIRGINKYIMAYPLNEIFSNG